MMDYRQLFLSQTPLIDVRAPIEFKTGHFPGAVNLPIMNDEERHLVGIEYKKNGQDAAIVLGHQLVSGEAKMQRVQAWKDFIAGHPAAKLYCFRGGLRSRTAGQWIREAGSEIDVIPGGYKKMRRFLIDALEKFVSEKKFTLLAGKTGVGKTKFLNDPRLKVNFLDLEKIANHKGSAFGAQGIFGYQDAQITFENKLAIESLRNENAPSCLLEDESRSIGMVEIPQSFFLKMKQAPIVILEKSESERIAWIFQEYVLDKTAFFQNDPVKTKDFLLFAVSRISKRLGGDDTNKISALIAEAFHSDNPLELNHHELWIRRLLERYYDARYGRQLDLKKDRVVFTGNESECFEYLNGAM